MTALRRLQQRFQAFILRGDRAQLGEEIVGGYGAEVDTRLDIYFDAYRLRLAEALRADYPALHALLGADRFEALAREYIAAHCSPYYNIRWYGDALGEFLRRRTPWRDWPWLAEMADFEWNMLAAFDAPEAPVAAIESMSAVPPEKWPELTFAVHPSVRRLELAFETPALWKANHAGEAIAERRPATAQLPWLMWRRGVDTYFRSMAQDEARAFDALREGAPFARVCERLGDDDGCALRAASLLKGWLSEALISRIVA